MHAHLRDLDPADRDAILDLMAGQLSSMVSLWTDLVRGAVSGSPRPVRDCGRWGRRRLARDAPGHVDGGPQAWATSVRGLR